jgi:hypothetical protein
MHRAGGVTVKGLNFTGSDGTINIPKALTIDADAERDNWVFAVAWVRQKIARLPLIKAQPIVMECRESIGRKTILVDMKLAGQNFPKGGSSSIDKSKNHKECFCVARARFWSIFKLTKFTQSYAIWSRDGIHVKSVRSQCHEFAVAAGSAALATNGSKISAGVAGAFFHWVEGITGAIVENVKFGSSTKMRPLNLRKSPLEAQRSGDIFAWLLVPLALQRKKALHLPDPSRSIF